MPPAISIVINVPELLMMLIGMVLSLVTWRRLRSAAVFALVGFAIMTLAALVSVASGILSAFLPQIRSEQHLSYAQIGTWFWVLSITRTVLALLGWVFILVAMFRRRPVPAASTRPGQAPPGGHGHLAPGGMPAGGPVLGQLPPQATAPGPRPAGTEARQPVSDEKSPFGGPGGQPTWQQPPS